MSFATFNMKLMRRLLFLLAIAVAAASCDDKPEPRLHFVGDSLVEFWDVASICPSLHFVNHGRAGAGIAYLGEFGSTLTGEDVVLLLGTNDLWQMLAYSPEEYAARYIDAVKSLGVATLYLYPVLPRDFTGDPEGSQEAIKSFNDEIRRRLDDFGCRVEYMDVYDRFRLGDAHLPNPELYPDGLHVNVYGYHILSDALWKRIF